MKFELIAISALTIASGAYAKDKVGISIQPAFHAIPVFAALEFGWYEELGIDVELSNYLSGAPQVKDAVEKKSWDFGIAGSVPNVLGGSQVTKTVAISNDESATTAVVGKPGLTEWPPTEVTADMFSATMHSTGELCLRKCMVAAGLDYTNEHVVYNTQGDIINNLKDADSSVKYGSLWAPNTYTYESMFPKDTKELCNCRTDIDFPIYGGIMMREEWAAQNPKLAAKVLAVYLRGVTFMQNANEIDRVIEISRKFYESVNVETRDEDLKEDLIKRPMFNLDEQLDVMSRNFANNYVSHADNHFIELESFLFEQNVIERKYEPREYITDHYVKLISQDPFLRAFTYQGATNNVKPILGRSTTEKVNISIQPAFHAIPIYAAHKYGWFKDLGMEVELFMYASGAPQVQDAVDHKKWDFGIAGSVPNVIGGAQVTKTVGINNDESATTEVYGAPGVTEWPPTTITDDMFSATKHSTGELGLRKCMAKAGLNYDDQHIKYYAQSDLLDQLADPSSATKYGSLWAPNTYTYREQHGSKAEMFCNCAKDIDFPIYGGLMFRTEFAENNPDLAAKVLAVYLRGVTFMQNKDQEDLVLEVAREFHVFAKIPAKEKDMQEDLIMRPLYNLDQQLDLMDRNFANNYISHCDKHFIELEDFLFADGVIQSKADTKGYITDEYMKLVSKDPQLRSYSYLGAEFDQTNLGVSGASTATSMLVSLLLGVVGLVGLLI